MDLPKFESEFEKDVFIGLRSYPKYLKSKYFYDRAGDLIFQEIMELPEYYLTSSEHEILNNMKAQIFSYLKPDAPFQLIDLGAGDAKKTRVLLDYLIQQKSNFTYIPVDISANAVNQLTSSLQRQYGNLQVVGLSQEYLSALRSLSQEQKKLVLFLGSSIGNFTRNETLDFLKDIFSTLNVDDLLLIGFDLKKDPNTILAAYNDNKGVTARFNLNLLKRINRELGANFDLDYFEHYPSYHEEKGEARSALVSLRAQGVEIPGINLTIRLEKGEKIDTEVSRKYNFIEIQRLAEQSGYEILANFTDSRKYFANSVWRRKKQ
ncbi:L-histidine N(alpha)-methyltransferase [Christiangramia fulva]|uniref:L-histidine N(Alpha)-methyltransferase n=2 Tax=Christiangramia fulva TaxID=2126553 RepID=A0A2R3ZAT0_9FLAO|nr:L-histidine N(alpha)-methyltransferase [Christiangramia fulva]